MSNPPINVMSHASTIVPPQLAANMVYPHNPNSNSGYAGCMSNLPIDVMSHAGTIAPPQLVPNMVYPHYSGGWALLTGLSVNRHCNQPQPLFDAVQQLQRKLLHFRATRQNQKIEEARFAAVDEARVPPPMFSASRLIFAFTYLEEKAREEYRPSTSSAQRAQRFRQYDNRCFICDEYGHFQAKCPLVGRGGPDNGDHLSAFVLDQNLEGYPSTMSHDMTLGDHIVLHAMVDMFSQDVSIVSSVEAPPSPPSTGTGGKKDPPLLLGHYAENHYASLDAKAEVELDSKALKRKDTAVEATTKPQADAAVAKIV
uniref:CCHC-type domain-containing protein n=1 Tax=Branchiostoma floridae TaxID=7739 RepID=C3YFJ6_BRAFL|eukprot:XP_002604949.1 hypothetical protein BRAFLDRAFT_92589 [Branchiostoma floridae]